MKPATKLFLIVAALLLTFAGTNVNAQQSVQAKVIGLKGEATVVTPGGTERPLVSGDLLPAGSTVQTSDDGNVVLGLLPGASTVLQTNTTLKINKLEIEKKNEKIASRTVELNMPNDKGGTLNFLNELDGASDYRIKTTTGIAAARGTAWQVSGGNITVLNGTVTFTSSATGGATVSIPQGSLFNGQSGTVVQLSQEDREAFQKAILQALGDGTATTTGIKNLVELTDLLDDIDLSNPANTSETIISPEQ